MVGVLFERLGGASSAFARYIPTCSAIWLHFCQFTANSISFCLAPVAAICKYMCTHESKLTNPSSENPTICCRIAQRIHDRDTATAHESNQPYL